MATIVTETDSFIKIIQLINSIQTLQKWGQTSTESSRNVVIKVYPSHYCNDKTPSTGLKQVIFFIFTAICHKPEWILLII